MESQGVPIEIFLKILQLLPHQQLLISKRVNRTWYAVISSEFQFKHTVLACCRPLAMRWHASYDFVNPDCLFQIQNELQLIDLRHFHFTKLQRLCLHWNKKDQLDRTNFSVGQLVNHLNQLEALELVGVQSGVSEEHLALANLKTLNIDEFWFTHLTVSCPQLVHLRLLLSYFFKRSRHRIEFEHPESVRCLEIERYRHEWVEKFVQLEELHVQYISIIPDTFLRELPRLQEIHFYEEANIYKLLVEQKIIYNRPNFRIFFCGFDTDALPEEALSLNYRCPSARAVRFLKEHYSKFVARHQTQIYCISYNLFEDFFSDGIPEELMQRLVSLQGLVIDRPVHDVEQLVRLLEITGPGLDLIRIQNTQLSEEFFDLLPKQCPAISELTIVEIEESEFYPEILLNFRGLRVIRLDIELTGTFAKTLFQNCDYLNLLCFRYKRYPVQLYRLPEGKLNLVFDRKDLLERYYEGESEMMAELGLKDSAQLDTLLDQCSAKIVF